MTHPHHPLYNQVVKVLRRAGNPAYPEPCYLIQLSDGSRAELPCSWAVPAAQAEAPRPTVEFWAGVEQYLALAGLVQALSTTHDVEGTSHEHNCFDCTPERDCPEPK